MGRPASVFLRASLQLSSCGRRSPARVSLYAPLLRRLYSTDGPKPTRGGSKVFRSADDAIADVQDGAVILSAGFGLCGVAGMSAPYPARRCAHLATCDAPHAEQPAALTTH